MEKRLQNQNKENYEMAVALDNVRLLQEETDSKNAQLNIEIETLNA